MVFGSDMCWISQAVQSMNGLGARVDPESSCIRKDLADRVIRKAVVCYVLVLDLGKECWFKSVFWGL